MKLKLFKKTKCDIFKIKAIYVITGPEVLQVLDQPSLLLNLQD